MFRVKCPGCGGILTIDERLRKVIGHVTQAEAAQKPEVRLESIMENIQKAKSEQEARLEAAKVRESQRKRRLDELFKKAQEKAKESGDEDKSRGPVWD